MVGSRAKILMMVAIPYRSSLKVTMPQATKIGWTDFSSNPLKYRHRETGEVVWACVKASPGCSRCYAESLAERWNRGEAFTQANMAKLEPFLDEDELRSIRRWPKIARRKVFLCDMTDLFGEWVTDDMLNRLFSDTLERRTDVTFQILTKRADRMAKYLSWRWGEGRIPCRHIHCGFSAENQEWFDKRAVQMAPLMRMGVKVWVSAEPLLGPIMMTGYDGQYRRGWLDKPGLSWIVVGGESGHGHRTCQVDDINSIVRQCVEAEVPVYVKQDCGHYPGKQGRIPLETWERKEFPA